jgi:hypothetical protein
VDISGSVQTPACNTAILITTVKSFIVKATAVPMSVRKSKKKNFFTARFRSVFLFWLKMIEI